MSGEALWILTAAGLAAIVLGLAIYVAALHARMRRLAGRIEDFLSCGGRPLSFSVREDALAPLHNAAAELQDRLLTAREHERGEGRRAGALTADISHQLKTPLATLRLYCELDGGAHLDGEIAQIERMEKLIYALLRLERLCASGYDFHFAAHDAAEIARRAWQPLGRLWPDRAFSIEGTARVRCDERWLGEALGNLFKNACEHTAVGGFVRVRIEQGEASALIVVEDDGGGVDKADLPRLFERFYRAKGAETGGAGLGLAIAREVVLRHHGDMRAENGESGLRVTVTLPVLQERLTIGEE